MVRGNAPFALVPPPEKHRHQGIGQHIPDGDPRPQVTAADPSAWQIRRKPILSDLINEYERAA
jgi:hypothetical protein